MTVPQVVQDVSVVVSKRFMTVNKVICVIFKPYKGFTEGLKANHEFSLSIDA